MSATPRLWRLVLLALVALNLTVVCQGHHEGTRYGGPHVLVLGEPAPEFVAVSAPEPQDASVASQQHIRLSATVVSSDTTPPMSESSMLGAALFLLACAVAGLAAIAHPLPSIRKSQVACRPTAPPPRLVLSPS
jgi:hypothetical protein